MTESSCWTGSGAAAIEHFAFNAWRRIADAEAYEKAVELRLRQRVRAVELLRVLRRDHEERFFEFVRFTVDRNLPLVHRFEERTLRLGRSAVDLVGEENLREDRAGVETRTYSATG